MSKSIPGRYVAAPDRHEVTVTLSPPHSVLHTMTNNITHQPGRRTL